MVAPPVCEPGKDTSVTSSSTSSPLSARTAAAFSQRVCPVPRVSPINSQVAFRLQVSGIVFNIADSSKGFHGSCLDPVSFPDRPLTLFRLSAFFIWLIPFLFQDRQSRPPVLIHSSNRLPSGNCDSLKFETSSSYLTEFGTVSNRSSLLSPFFAFTDGPRRPPEELVNSASAFEPFGPL